VPPKKKKEEKKKNPSTHSKLHIQKAGTTEHCEERLREENTGVQIKLHLFLVSWWPTISPAVLLERTKINPDFKRKGLSLACTSLKHLV
jgi:hypothetical protein